MTPPYPPEQLENDHLNTVILELQRELKIATDDLAVAITFIKELNATKYQHGRQYRSRCGQFLSKHAHPNI